VRFRRGRQHRGDPSELAELTRLTASVQETAAALHESNAEMLETLEHIRSDLDELSAPRAGLNAYIVKLVIGCLVLFLIAALLIQRGVQAFANPDPRILPEAGPGGIAIVIFGSDKLDPALSASPETSISAQYVPGPRGSAMIEYQFDFPASLAGRYFAVLLQGSATLDTPTVTSSLPAFDIKQSDNCWTKPNKFVFEPPCQAIIGYLPNVAGGPVSSNNCGDNTGEHGFLLFEVSGYGPTYKKLDWAHSLYSIPGIGSFDPSFDPGEKGAKDSWHDLKLPMSYAVLPHASCKLTEYMPGEVVLGSYGGEPGVSYNAFSWNGDAARNDTTVVTKNRNTETFGNAYVSIGGICAALAIGLVPLLFESFRQAQTENSRRRRPARNNRSLGPL
jgi:hypothetical protein